MKYQIVGKNIRVTEAIKNSIEKKIGRIDKFFLKNDEILCRVLVRSYPVGAKVEITIFTSVMDIRAEEFDDDLYNAVDKAIDALEGQIEKLKAKLNRKKKGNKLHDFLILDNIIEEYNVEEEKVVRTKSIYLEPMHLDDAIMRMEALGHKFFMYLDADDNMISVLYIRNDGGYGILEAENKIA